MDVRHAVLAITVTFLVTWAAEDAVVAPQAATSFEPQAPSYEADAITIPKMLSYQGRLTDSAGRPVRDSTWSVVFRLYTQPSGGSAFWNETQSVTTKGGLFTVLLGAVTPVGSVPDGGALYLGMQVGASELAPRLRLVSAAYAYKADSAFYAAAAAPAGAAGGDLAGSYPNPTIGQKGATVGQVLKWSGSVWQPGNDSVGGSGGGGTVTSVGQAAGVTCTPNPITTAGTIGFDQAYGDGRYVNSDGDSMSGALAVQSDLRVYGKGRIGPSNTNTGISAFVAGQSNSADGDYASVGGGTSNAASGYDAPVGGGDRNTASGNRSTVGGGRENTASSYYATVGGGYADTTAGYAAGVLSGWNNLAGDGVYDTAAVVAGGRGNRAIGTYTTVSGGYLNFAGSMCDVVCGGRNNTAVNQHGTVGGGAENNAGSSCVVGGGYRNHAQGAYATVAGGIGDTSAGAYSFTVGNHSRVASSYANSAALNGTAATASSQTSVGTLKQGFAAFSIDHPLDPDGRILNQYVTGSNEALMTYRGVATVGSDGQVAVQLPDYFDALCRNAMIQLTGVGTYEVFVAGDEQDNRFTIGGKAGTKVYWTVTGERDDKTAAIGRAMQPVEMRKTGDLAGVSLDDGFLSGCKEQLEREGKAAGIDFRTAAGRRRYQEMRRALQEQGK